MPISVWPTTVGVRVDVNAERPSDGSYDEARGSEFSARINVEAV